jgi:hypothetical protein
LIPEGFRPLDLAEFFVFERNVKGLIADQRRWSEDWLWIDALCIDQADARERTHQVGIMSEIFGRADQVISWLGPAYDNSEHAMTTIAYYASDTSTSAHSFLSQAELSQAICNLCERPYWKRLWVFQELRHARHITLMCGDTTISWHQFRLLWRAIVDIATTDRSRSDRLKQSLATRMMTLRSKPMDFSLWNLLRETQTLECSNPRDRVYALLSVATVGHEDIQADYSLDPLYLAHRILRMKYTMRRPGALDDVLLDCKFLEGVFGMTVDIMLRYRRHGAGSHNDSQEQWCDREWFWVETLKLDRGEVRDENSYVDTESPQAAQSWLEWAQFTTT